MFGPWRHVCARTNLDIDAIYLSMAVEITEVKRLARPEILGQMDGCPRSR